MPGLLADKAVLVSGGTQGVGAGVARAAVAAGAQVVVTGRRPEVGKIAEMVVHLLSDRSGVVTGSIIDWDQTIPGAYDQELMMRLGLIGLGRIGAFHADTLARLPAVSSLVVTDAVPAAIAASPRCCTRTSGRWWRTGTRWSGC